MLDLKGISNTFSGVNTLNNINLIMYYVERMVQENLLL